MQPIMGRKYQARNASEKRCWSRNSPIGWSSAARPPGGVERHRRREPIEAQDLAQHAPELAAAPGWRAGRRRCRGCSRSTRENRLRTENDISEGAVATPSSANRATQLRVGLRVEDQKAGVDAVGQAFAASDRPCSCARRTGRPPRTGSPAPIGASARAAARPAMPEPIDGDPLHGRAPARRPAKRREPLGAARNAKRNVAERPRRNEGGRREEENPPGISAGKAGRLRDENRFAAIASAIRPAPCRQESCDVTQRAGMTPAGVESSRPVRKTFAVAISPSPGTCTQTRPVG